ncbi:MAG: hypothetical protein OEL75_03785 [Kiritimatiellaceae bacterium]|nr:hypothetical protein [Kiritimatiellaceae bacterium]
MKNRGNDLADIFDIGITVNGGAPQFRLEFQPFLFPIGYSNLDGKLIGFGNRKWGVNEFESKGWGALLTGEGKYGTGPFNPCDPRQYEPIDDPENAPEERPSYAMGLIPVMQDGNDLWAKNIECNKGIHLGWIGIHLPCRPLDLVDFVLGFTTLDIMKDDAVAVDADEVTAPAEEQ